MKKQSVFYPLIFGVVFLILGIAVKQYSLSAFGGIISIIIFVILCIHDNKEKKLIRKAKEYEQFRHTAKHMVTLEKTKKASRYLSVSKSDNQPYEEWCKYAEVGLKKVTVYKKPPQKISFKEFINLVDEKYPETGILYEGINENNWESYLDVMQFKNKIPEDKKPLTKEYLDSLSNKYEFKRKKFFDFDNPPITSLVAISEFLFKKGFIFKKASADGGVDEISHTGDKAYSAEYTDFEEFRNNFVSDFKKTEEIEIQKYGGWVSSLNYRYVVVMLERNELSVEITVNSNSYTVIWGETSENISSLKDEINNQILDVIGNDFYLSKYSR